MAKKEKDFDETHRRNLKSIQTKIDRIFAKAAEEAALIGVNIDAVLPDDKIFSFDDYPKTKKMIDELLHEISDSIEDTIVNGVRQGWDLSNEKNDILANRVFGKNIGTLTAAQKQRYFNNNASALDAFIARKTSGLNLSDRVWRYSNQFKSEIEMGLDLGIRSGQSAASMTRSLRDYLKYPDKLFRRVRDKHGLLRLSQAAKDFHTGRGVYRSSYKNARRLAATETNIAYRTSDYLRWQQMDFVVGIEVLLSNNHTVKLQPGETTDDPTQLRKDGTPKANAVRPLHDICDELKGRYPKDFKFTGWHPQCRCYAVSILKTPEEVADDAERESRGEQPSSESVNTVHDTPEAFNEWVRDHADKIKTSKSVPYFIRDNQQRVDEIIKNKSNSTKKTALDIAAERHAARTKNDAEKIEMAWRQKLIRDITLESARYGDNALMDGYVKSMRNNRIIGDAAAFTSDYNNAKKLLATLRRENTSALTFTDEQMKRFAEMETAMKTKRGAPMTLREADMQSANPDYKHKSPYSINCQTCAPTYVLRSQGFPVVATGNVPGSVQEWISHSHSFDIWENIDGTPAKPTLYRDWLDAIGGTNMSAKRYKAFFEEATTEPGIYITTIAWKGRGAHATIIQRFADGTLAYIEPQHFNGTMKRSIDELCNGGKTKIPTWSKRGIMRVDDKMLKRICRDGGKDYDIWSIFGIK